MSRIQHRKEAYVSPQHYRRRTLDHVDYHPHSVPNSARLSNSSTPRPVSALDRRMVHRSFGDLTMDVDLQSTHPRLQADFYQDLYKRYPHAFRRRLEAREAGRRLFNKQTHVRFKEEVEFSDDNYLASARNSHVSPEHVTNWDREVGHYFKHRSPTRDCITSLEPSECSGSVLSVSQRLRLNSQNLNKLLNERTSPLRKYQQRVSVQYDSGTENEQSLQDYMLEKSKERSRHRKKQRIIIQRKLNQSENGDVLHNKENNLQTRRWMSRSTSPTARHCLQYSLPTKQQLSLNQRHDLNIDDLLSDSDLKIDTLLEKISMKVVSPDSPPDSAIDVETPSVQSVVAMGSVAMETQNDIKIAQNDSKQNDRNGQSDQNGDVNLGINGAEKSPGSSASSSERKSKNKQTENTTGDKNILMETVTCESLTYSETNVDNLPIEDIHKSIDINPDFSCITETTAVANIQPSTQQINKTSRDSFTNPTQLNTTTQTEEIESSSSGLLKVCTSETIFNTDGAENDMGINDVSDPKCNDNEDILELDGDVDGVNSIGNTSQSDSESQKTVQSFSRDTKHKGAKFESENLENGNFETEDDVVESKELKAEKAVLDDIEALESEKVDSKGVNSVEIVKTSCELERAKLTMNYNADDEGDELVIMDMRYINDCRQKQKQRDSDVDSGIGQSSCTETLPLTINLPTDKTLKPNITKANNGCFPSRMDMCKPPQQNGKISKPHFSRNMTSHIRGNWDDTTYTSFAKFRGSGRETKVAEKFRKYRSPSPFVLTVRQPGTDRMRPKSAPLFVKSELDLRIVDIPLTDDSINRASRKSAHESRKSHSKHDRLVDGGLDNGFCEHQLCNDAIPKSQNVSQSKPARISTSMKYASTGDLLNNEITQGQLNKHNHASSNENLNYDRRHSFSSGSSIESSLSPVSDSEIENFNDGEFNRTTSNSKISWQPRITKYSSQPNLGSKVITQLGNKVHFDDQNFCQREGIQQDFYPREGIQQDFYPREGTLAGKKGNYKPSASSPRVKEKRLKMRNLLKVKKGAFEPNVDEMSGTIEVKRIYAKNRGSDRDEINSVGGENGDGSDRVNKNRVSNDPNADIQMESNVGSENITWIEQNEQDVDNISGSCGSTGSSLKSCMRVRHSDPGTDGSSNVDFNPNSPNDTESVNRFLVGADVNVVSAKPVIMKPKRNSEPCGEGSRRSSQGSGRALPRTPDSDPGPLDCNFRPKVIPPKKPARTKHKNIPADLNLSKYKITAVSNPELNSRTSPLSVCSAEVNSQPDVRYMSHDRLKGPDFRKTSTSSTEAQDYQIQDVTEQRLQANTSSTPVHHSPDDVIEVMSLQRSHLGRTKEPTPPPVKPSLFGKTKGKLKNLKKALSLERGIDNVGKVEQNGRQQQGGHSNMPKVKKAPSLKSITSLFKRKKKKGKLHINDIEDNSTNYPNSTNPHYNRGKQWSSCSTLNTDPNEPIGGQYHSNGPMRAQQNSNHPMETQNNSNQPIGKLEKVNPDGTQIIQLTKPQNGPIGFYIAKGNAKSGNGIFVSRFSLTRPDVSFAGLLAVGDEILEVNGRNVRDFNQDSVYHLISASPVVVMKILPFIARKDV